MENLLNLFSDNAYFGSLALLISVVSYYVFFIAGRRKKANGIITGLVPFVPILLEFVVLFVLGKPIVIHTWVVVVSSTIVVMLFYIYAQESLSYVLVDNIWKEFRFFSIILISIGLLVLFGIFLFQCWHVSIVGRVFWLVYCVIGVFLFWQILKEAES